MRVWLLSGTSAEPGFQAWSLDRLGFATWGPTRSDVLDRVPGKLDLYMRWMAVHQLPAREVQGRRLEVAQEISGHEPLFTADREQVTLEEIDLAMAMLRAGHQDLVALLNSMSDGFLGWEPPYRQFAQWADWQSVGATLAHMANAESHYYLAMVGYEPQRASVSSEDDWQDYLPIGRSDTIEHLADLRSSTDRARVQTRVRRGRRTPDGEVEEWSVRKALRRMVRHDLLHLSSIQRIRLEWERTATA